MFNSVVKFFGLLSNKYKFFYICLFISFGINVLIDLISIAAIFPIIFFIFDKDAVFNSIYYEKVINFFSNIGLDFQYENSVSFLISLLIILIIIFAIRTLIGLLINYFSIKLDIKTKVFIKDLLFKNYFSQNNNFQFFNNLATVNRTFSPDIEHTSIFFNGFFLIVFDIIFSLILIISLYFIYEKLIIYFFLILLLLGTLYLILINKKLSKDGINRQKMTAENFKIIQQLYNTTKEIIFYGREKYFRNYYINQSNRMYQTYFFKMFLNKSIRFIIELLMFSFLSFLLIYFLYQERELNIIIAEVSVFFIILVRLSPSCLRILSTYQDMKFAVKSVDNIFDFLEYKLNDLQQNRNKKNLEKIENINQINVENLCFEYDNKKKIISNLNSSFDVSKPTFVSGISGKGKTTLLSLICGFLKPKKGQILFDGVELKSIHQFSKNLIGYISQESFLIDETIDSNITFGLKEDKIDKERLEDIKGLLGINESNFSPNFTESTIGENGSKLSGGQKQRISLARLLYQNPKLIILDEATNSLDRKSELEIYKNVFNWGQNEKIFICISHNIPSNFDINTIYLN